MPTIPWDDTILLGIDIIDDDHKFILSRINSFILAIEDGKNFATIRDAFREMEQSIFQHLAFEEGLLQKAGYTGFDGHKATHDRLTDELEQIWDDMLADPSFQPNAAARAWIESWLFVHVRNEDFAYRQPVIESGVLDGY